MIYPLTASKKRQTQDDRVTFWKLVNNLYFTCWDAEIPWIAVRLKIVVQEREFSEYLRNQLEHLKPDDSEIICGPSCRIIAVSVYTRNVSHALATAGDALDMTTWTCRDGAYCRF